MMVCKGLPDPIKVEFRTFAKFDSPSLRVVILLNFQAKRQRGTQHREKFFRLHTGCIRYTQVAKI